MEGKWVHVDGRAIRVGVTRKENEKNKTNKLISGSATTEQQDSATRCTGMLHYVQSEATDDAARMVNGKAANDGQMWH